MVRLHGAGDHPRWRQRSRLGRGPSSGQGVLFVPQPLEDPVPPGVLNTMVDAAWQAEGVWMDIASTAAREVCASAEQVQSICDGTMHLAAGGPGSAGSLVWSLKPGTWYAVVGIAENIMSPRRCPS